MKTTTFNKRNAIVFKHFNRKGYSLFAALGKVVVIGVLAVPTLTFAKADGIAMWITFFGVIFIDISTGLMIGIVSTFILMLWRISRPHMAVIGLVEGTQHFRNVQRRHVLTSPEIMSMRIDENLTFLNANALKGFLINQVSQHPQLRHVVINCSSVSSIDFSALEMLEDINGELDKLDIRLHFSEIKGPVMDRLQHSKLLKQLSGQIYLTHYQAMQDLSRNTAEYLI